MIFALVHNWPGAKNSEFDIILRIQKELDLLGFASSIIDPLGNILNKETLRTGDSLDRLNPPDVIINLHYTNPNFFSSLSYVVNWNPIAYIYQDPSTRMPLPEKQLAYYIDCLRSHDRVLSAGSDLLDNYQAVARQNLPFNLDDDSQEKLKLHTTISSLKTTMPLNSLDVNDAKVFYVGVNWEKISQKQGVVVRHEGLFEVLDETGDFKFYGLSRLHGVDLWEGIKSYCGELPFDGGGSLTEAAAKCGISLILSSDAHKESGLVSTRIFQACKAGTVIVSDRNPFVEKYFKESVYYFDDEGCPQQTAENIKNVIKEIKSNWKAACQKAYNAQRIFIDKFALEKEVKGIAYQAQIDIIEREKLISFKSQDLIYILCFIQKYDRLKLTELIVNLSCQVGCNIKLLLGGYGEVKKDVVSFLSSNKVDFDYEFIEIPLGYQQGFLVQSLFLKNISRQSKFLFYSFGFKWHPDHLFCLLSAIKNSLNPENVLISCAPLFIDYLCLRDKGRDLMEFFIEGLSGGCKLLDLKNIQSFEWSDFPTGNLLLSSDFFTNHFFDSTRIHLLSQLGPTAIYCLLFLESCQKKYGIVNTGRITSRYLVVGKVFERQEYFEYTSCDQGVDRMKLDRSILYSFFRYCDGVDLHRLDMQRILWESSYDVSGQGDRQRTISYNKEFALKLLVTEKRVSPFEHLKNRLRSYPYIFKCVRQLFRFLQKTIRR